MYLNLSCHVFLVHRKHKNLKRVIANKYRKCLPFLKTEKPLVPYQFAFSVVDSYGLNKWRYWRVIAFGVDHESDLISWTINIIICL